VARQSRLSALSINALVKMRDEIGAILGRRADALKKELQAIGDDYKAVGRIAVYGRKKQSRKVGAKYRHPKTKETWSGRGLKPRWLMAQIKAGKKADDFLIIKASRKKSARRKKK
jgi:DNA-binding protein H-NS